jgi:hypothetical protein
MSAGTSESEPAWHAPIAPAEERNGHSFVALPPFGEW